MARHSLSDRADMAFEVVDVAGVVVSLIAAGYTHHVALR